MSARLVTQKNSQQSSLSDGITDHRPNPTLGRALEPVLLGILLTAFVCTGLIPAWRHLNSDFPNYYLVAKLYRAGTPLDHIYDWVWLQREKDHQGLDVGVITFVPLTLPSALILEPLTSLSPLDAKRCWLAINVVFLLLVGHLLTRMTQLGTMKVALLMSGAVVALRNNFIVGQMHVLVLLLLTVAAWLYFRKSPFLSGLTLAFAAALKIYPALFLILFLLRRCWRAAAGLAVGLAGFAVACIYLCGWNVCLTYARSVLPAAARGEVIDPYNVAWGSITALLRHLLIFEPELNPHPITHLPWLYALLQPAIHGLIFVGFMWAMNSQTEDAFRAKREWAIYLFVLLFISSQPAGYHFVVLILPAALIFDEMTFKGKHSWATIFVTTYVLVCIATLRMPSNGANGWYTLAFFPRLWLLSAMAAILFMWIFVASGQLLRREIRSITTAIAAAIWVLLTLGGFISTRTHLKGEFANYTHRVLSSPGSLFAACPLFLSDRTVAAVMTSGGYTIREDKEKRITDVARGGRGDWLHPAGSIASKSLWVEEASPKGSLVIRWTDPSNPQSGTEQIDHAQEPVVSTDNQFLAFVRTDRGRNALWLRRTGAGGYARQIVGTDYDPQDAAFLPDDALMFSSKRGGRYAIYRASAWGNVRQFETPACSARFPAVSPDGRWMAFSCQESGNWNLHAMELGTGRELRLTNAECNSTTSAWTADSKKLIYATDCGRGYGLSALVEIDLPN